MEYMVYVHIRLMAVEDGWRDKTKKRDSNLKLLFIEYSKLQS